jgi:hypothetical protein
MSSTLETTSEEALCARFEQSIARRPDLDANAKWRGRTLTADCVIQIGAIPFLLRIERGEVTQCTRKLPLLCHRDFTLKGSVAAWSALWERYPRAGWHDLFALTKRGEMTLEGDMQKVFAHLQYLKDLISSPRNGTDHE